MTRKVYVLVYIVYRVENAGIGKRKCKTCASYRGPHICATEFELAYYKPMIAKMAIKLWEQASQSKEDSDTEAEQEEAPQEEAYSHSKDDWEDDDWDETAFYEGLETYGLATYNVHSLELDISE